MKKELKYLRKTIIIKKQFTQTQNLLYKAQREIYKEMKITKYSNILFIWIPLFLIIFNSIIGNTESVIFESIPFWLELSIPIIFLSIIIPLGQYWATKKSSNYIKNYIISEDNITYSSDLSNSTIKWMAIKQLIVSKIFLLFFMSSNCALFIPIEILSKNEIDEIYIWFDLNKRNNSI